MARVFGLEIHDTKMAKIAQTLLRAHICVVLLAASYAIIQIAEYFVAQAAIDEVASTGDNKDTGVLSVGWASIILEIILPLLCPLGIFLVVRSGVQNNNQSIMQTMCFLDGCCSAMTCCGVLIGILWFIWLMGLKQWANDHQCSQDKKPEACEQTLAAVRKGITNLGVIVILAIILSLCQTIACIIGTVKSNEASNMLLQSQLFCTQTGAPVGPAGPIAGGVVMGQPLGNAVTTMGQPVRSAFGPQQNA